MTGFPPIHNVEDLENLLSEPTDAVVETMRRLKGDLIFLGVAGKMGPTLARMAKRASEKASVNRRVIGVSRFSSGDHEKRLQACGIETIRCDLLDERELAKLPEAANVLFMAGLKFGSQGQQSQTWAMNGYLPALVCKKFQRSRIVAFSSGNVYGLTTVDRGGSTESDALNPVGEYAMSCVARERIFEYFSRTLNLPISLVRLNYAGELRYGVLVDLAQRVLAGEPIDLSMGHLNTIWQGDANAMTLQAFDHVSSPPFVVNLTGTEVLSVRSLAAQFGELMKKPVRYIGSECPTALLSNARQAHDLFGQPRITTEQMVFSIAEWLRRGGPSLGKPTGFESRDGKF